MYKIVRKDVLNPTVSVMEIEAPLVARKAQPGQFEPVGNGRVATIIANGPVESCMAAAKDVLEGKRNIPYYYFKAAWYAEQHGISGVNIGGNVFHK